MNYLLQQIIALFLLLLLLPLCVIIFVLCLAFQSFPVLYRERRLGLHKKEFIIWKFRTMYTKCQEGGIRCCKRPDDPRITSWGHFLRRFSLDELPQLWNVIKGEMSLIGPRPISAEEDLLYGKYSILLHSVKPGISGLWQISGRNELSYHRRIAINRYYVSHRSFQLDLWIFWKTIDAVISGRGAY